MYPTIRHGDRVEFDRHQAPQVGDLVVYIRRDALVAHRVVEMGANHLTTRGDNQGDPREEVPLSAVVGTITRIMRREGSVVKRGSPGQVLGDRAWVRAPGIMKIVARLWNLPWRARQLLARPPRQESHSRSPIVT